MGRPRLDISDSERVQRQRDQRAASKAKTKNLTVDDDMVDLVNGYCDSLEADFGFRPTISQGLRHLILKATKTK